MAQNKLAVALLLSSVLSGVAYGMKGKNKAYYPRADGMRRLISLPFECVAKVRNSTEKCVKDGANCVSTMWQNPWGKAAGVGTVLFLASFPYFYWHPYSEECWYPLPWPACTKTIYMDGVI